jgi:hypothetical protein
LLDFHYILIASGAGINRRLDFNLFPAVADAFTSLRTGNPTATSLPAEAEAWWIP